MRTLVCRDWKDFHAKLLYPYAARPRDERRQLLFRGQSDARWPVRATLDRARVFADDAERNRLNQLQLEEFRREAISILAEPQSLPDGPGFELLARHHGVPSPLLDWTESPYIAAYFAFEDNDPRVAESVAIWAFDRARFVFEESGIDLIDDRDLLRFNRRALRQRGVFMRVRSVRRPFEEIVGEALTKIVLPANDRDFALADLDAMVINSAVAFGDLDGAARTTRSRFRGG